MKVLCVLYDDPKGGMPKSYPVASLPKLDNYPDGMALPTPKGIKEKSALTYRFIERKKREFEFLKQEIKALEKETNALEANNNYNKEK